MTDKTAIIVGPTTLLSPKETTWPAAYRWLVPKKPTRSKLIWPTMNRISKIKTINGFQEANLVGVLSVRKPCRIMGGRKRIIVEGFRSIKA